MPHPTTVALDNLSHIIQVALTPIFLLSALATLLNVFATRHGRIGDQVRDLSQDLKKGSSLETKRLARQLSELQRRSLLLDGAVCLVALAGFLTGIAAMVLFIGELRNATTETVLYGCFGLALAFTVAAIAGFLCEILMASRSIRLEVGHQQDTAVAAAD